MRMQGGWYWAGLLVFAAGMAAYAYRNDVVGLFHDYRYSQERVQQLEARLGDLEKQETALRQRVEDLDKRDPLTLEREVRQGKGLVREGEKIFRVEPGPAPAP